ncbi:MAG: outer membrane protein assembly factor [Rhodobacteraceae bacterium]|nr:MAG: outer membrane protein assembly factor [Paracoccaceae bacterium]
MRQEFTGRLVRAGILAALLACPGLAAAFDLTLEVRGADLRDRLQAASRLSGLAGQDGAEAQEIIAAAQADYANLTAALYDAGHFGGVIRILVDGREAARISQLDLPGSVARVTVSVETGPAFRLGAASIAPVAPGSELPAGFAPGQPAQLGVVRDTVRTGIEGWRAQGHARARLSDQQITARHRADQLDVSIRLDPGRVYRFGDLVIRGASDVRPERIREIAGLPTGARYDPEALDLATRRLRRTGTFSAATLSDAETDGPDDTLDIVLDISDRPKRSFGFGAEIASFEGLSVSGYWQHRNLLGGAERLRFEAEISGIGGDSGGADGRLSARFDRPATFSQDNDFYVEAEALRRDDVDFTTTRVAIEAGVVRYATAQRTYEFGLGLVWGRSEDAFGRRDYSLVTLPLGVEFDHRDDRLNAHRGWFLDLELIPFYALSGIPSGLIANADLRGYRSFGTGDRLTLAGRFQLGSLSGLPLAQAPADALYYSGGGGTVRGQPFQSNGIDLPGGLRSGGRSFLGLSGEVRFDVTDTIGAVGFVDAGYIGAESFPDGSGTWHSGAGLGLRYDTGIGPIRFDVAFPVSGPGDDGVQIYIGIGQAF